MGPPFLVTLSVCVAVCSGLGWSAPPRRGVPDAVAAQTLVLALGPLSASCDANATQDATLDALVVAVRVAVLSGANATVFVREQFASACLALFGGGAVTVVPYDASHETSDTPRAAFPLLSLDPRDSQGRLFAYADEVPGVTTLRRDFESHFPGLRASAISVLSLASESGARLTPDVLVTNGENLCIMSADVGSTWAPLLLDVVYGCEAPLMALPPWTECGGVFSPSNYVAWVNARLLVVGQPPLTASAVLRDYVDAIVASLSDSLPEGVSVMRLPMPSDCYRYQCVDVMAPAQCTPGDPYEVRDCQGNAMDNVAELATVLRSICAEYSLNATASNSTLGFNTSCFDLAFYCSDAFRALDLPNLLAPVELINCTEATQCVGHAATPTVVRQSRSHLNLLRLHRHVVMPVFDDTSAERANHDFWASLGYQVHSVRATHAPLQMRSLSWVLPLTPWSRAGGQYSSAATVPPTTTTTDATTTDTAATTTASDTGAPTSTAAPNGLSINAKLAIAATVSAVALAIAVVVVIAVVRRHRARNTDAASSSFHDMPLGDESAMIEDSSAVW